jgi:hypothetical protein
MPKELNLKKVFATVDRYGEVSHFYVGDGVQITLRTNTTDNGTDKLERTCSVEKLVETK